MAYYKVKKRLLKSLKEEDRQALKAIYLHRCLNQELLARFFYNNDSEFTAQRIQYMTEKKILEPKDYGHEYPALFLMTLGVVIVKYLYEDELEKAYKKRKEFTALPLSKNLKLHENSINHQMHLNQFHLEFEEYAKDTVEHSYFDEKFMPPAHNFMKPDGIIELPDCFLFLEMDMCTEKAPRLNQKWESYRMFLREPGQFYDSKPVIMLFILENTKRPAYRRKGVVSTLLGYLIDHVNGDFEVYAGDPASLHSLIRQKILKIESDNETIEMENLLKNKFDFTVSSPKFLKTLEYPVQYYIRQLDNTNHILNIDGKNQEFLMDIWLDTRVSIDRNLMYSDRLVEEVSETTKRNLPYLIVVPSEKWLAKELKIARVKQFNQQVYFTTPKRLQARVWEKAVFQFDQLGSLYHFETKSLTEPVYESRYRKMFENLKS